METNKEINNDFPFEAYDMDGRLVLKNLKSGKVIEIDFDTQRSINNLKEKNDVKGLVDFINTLFTNDSKINESIDGQKESENKLKLREKKLKELASENKIDELEEGISGDDDNNEYDPEAIKKRRQADRLEKDLKEPKHLTHEQISKSAFDLSPEPNKIDNRDFILRAALQNFRNNVGEKRWTLDFGGFETPTIPIVNNIPIPDEEEEEEKKEDKDFEDPYKDFDDINLDYSNTDFTDQNPEDYVDQRKIAFESAQKKFKNDMKDFKPSE